MEAFVCLYDGGDHALLKDPKDPQSVQEALAHRSTEICTEQYQLDSKFFQSERRILSASFSAFPYLSGVNICQLVLVSRCAVLLQPISYKAISLPIDQYKLG